MAADAVDDVSAKVNGVVGGVVGEGLEAVADRFGFSRRESRTATRNTVHDFRRSKPKRKTGWRPDGPAVEGAIIPDISDGAITVVKDGYVVATSTKYVP